MLCLQNSLKVIHGEATVAQNFVEHARADCFTRMYRDDRCPSICVPQEMMATFDSNNFEPNFG